MSSNIGICFNRTNFLVSKVKDKKGAIYEFSRIVEHKKKKPSIFINTVKFIEFDYANQN